MVSSRRAGDAVGIGVEEAQPAQAVDAGECVEQRGEAVFQAEVFAVAGGVLADERDLLHAAGDELLRFGDDGLEAARAEFAAQVGNDAEAAGVVAALGDFDVGRGARRGEKARGGFVVEVGGQQVRCALPVVAAEAALALAMVAFGAALRAVGVLDESVQRPTCAFRACDSLPDRVSAWTAGEDVEGRRRGGRVGRDAGGFEDGFELAGADDGVDFRDVFLNFVAIALDEAAGDDELACAALGLVAGHLEDGVD